MNLIISPSQAQGTVTAPPSKSMTHRMLIAAALCGEARAVDNLEWSDDVHATLACLQAWGPRPSSLSLLARLGRDGTVRLCPGGGWSSAG